VQPLRPLLHVQRLHCINLQIDTTLGEPGATRCMAYDVRFDGMPIIGRNAKANAPRRLPQGHAAETADHRAVHRQRLFTEKERMMDGKGDIIDQANEAAEIFRKARRSRNAHPMARRPRATASTATRASRRASAGAT
jgi:hypothetical protein